MSATLIEGEVEKRAGELLRRAREGVGLSIRAAAAKAGFSEATWRALELGERRPAKGIAVPVSPNAGTLRAAAQAVGIPMSELFAAYGKDMPEFWHTDVIASKELVPADLDGRLADLTEEEVAQVAAYIDGLIDRRRR